jgi:hypothetical protein
MMGDRMLAEGTSIDLEGLRNMWCLPLAVGGKVIKRWLAVVIVVVV